MIQLLSKIWLVILIASTIIGCKSTEEVVPDIDMPTWTIHPEIRLDRRLQIQARATDDRLWLMGNNHLLSLDDNHRLTSDVLVAPFGNELWYRSFLSDDLFATELKRQHVFDLRLNRKPDTKVRIDLREFDSTVQEINSHYNPPMAINSRGQILLGGWVNAAEYPGITGLPLFVFQTDLANDSLSVTLQRQIWVNQGIVNVAGNNRLNGIYAYGDTFYFSNSNLGFYQLLPHEEPELLFPMSLVHMLQVHDTLMAIGYLQDGSLGWYFRRRKEGAWEMRNFQALDNGFMRFEAIQDRIIAYRRGQLWELLPDKDISSLEIRELNNLGLDQVTIHDVEVFEERVYLCTDRGLYYQSLADFFTYKPLE